MDQPTSTPLQAFTNGIPLALVNAHPAREILDIIASARVAV
jgi:hypothetical protein